MVQPELELEQLELELLEQLKLEQLELELKLELLEHLKLEQEHLEGGKGRMLVLVHVRDKAFICLVPTASGLRQKKNF